ncbi:MAG: nonstructural protein [Microviridae sp.]|nr:MAG: nonstructural protein [Microviridae sp.]
MLSKLFGIYDSKVGAWLQPFYSQSVGSAERAIERLVADPEHNFCQYASDFTLFELGSFDDATGLHSMLSTPHSLGLFVNYKRRNLEETAVSRVSG